MPLSDCSLTQTVILPEYNPSQGLKFIPVVVHILIGNMNVGAISDSVVQTQIDILNADFRALPGTKGDSGTDTKIRFFLAQVDPDGNPTTGITRTTNNSWHNDIGNYWDTLAWDTTRYLNIYTNTAGPVTGYVPDLPQGGSVLGTAADRVVIDWRNFGWLAPAGPPFNLGQIVTHEVGHYLGLDHTFAGDCAPAANCYMNGDLICDTNPENGNGGGGPSYTGLCPNGQMSCGFLAPIHNYMNYTSHACLTEFTREQTNRMRCTIENYRMELSHPPFICGVPLMADEGLGEKDSLLPLDTSSSEDFTGGGGGPNSLECATVTIGGPTPQPQGSVDLTVSPPAFFNASWGTITTDCCGDPMPLIGRFAGPLGSNALLVSQVTNLGPGWLNPGTFRVSWAQRWAHSQNFAFDHVAIPALGPGESVMVCTRFGPIPPFGFPPGFIYQASVRVDRDDLILEIDEENNDATQQFCNF